MVNQGLIELVEKLKGAGYLKLKRTEKAILAVDRGYFVPEYAKTFAYYDQPIPIEENQAISAPSVVSFMLDALDVRPEMNVLEIGTGSGYNAALLSFLVGRKGLVTSIEFYEKLHEFAKKNIGKVKNGEPKLEFKNLNLVLGDGSLGYEISAPYDAIISTAAISGINEMHPFVQQLKEDGKLIAPVGTSSFQDLILYSKKTNLFRKILPVMFVPMRGVGGIK
ncbi:protein-L-isoaspartate O-methyltransferase [Candidatus Micrarchaeota archaeon]|nr:protein-L-isoaspartate O-methyltransferase [Candidatus Micrarchaeota archaeon]